MSTTGPSTVSVLLITGTVGAGKTALARELGELLRHSGVTSGIIDLDALSGVSPAEADDRFNSKLVVRNLGAIWPNYAARGVTHLVLARFVAGAEELDAYRAAIPLAALTVCRVTAPAETVRKRLQQREIGVARDFLLRLSTTLDRDVGSSGFEDFVVENGPERTITDVAREVLDRAGWSLL